VIAVRVGQQDRVDVVEAPADRLHRPDEEVPVAWRASVDESELPAVLDQVEVDDSLA
jgi:hypothetical protein